MRKRLTYLLWCCLPGLAIAQNHHYSDNEYNVSVYENYRNIPAPKSIHKMQTKERVNQQFPSWYVFTDKLTGNFSDIFGDALPLQGNTTEEKVAYSFQHQLKDLGIEEQEWILTKHHDADFAEFFHYKQQLNGHDVVFSKLSFRFTEEGDLQRIKHKSYGTPGQITPTLTKEQALILAKEDLQTVNIQKASIQNDWYWFPVPSANGYELRPSWKFSIEGKGPKLPVLLSGYIDGITGDILYRINDVMEAIDLTVQGDVFKTNPLLPKTSEPLKNLKITIGSTNYFTDSAGKISDANLTVPLSAIISLEGRWSTAVNRAAGNATPSYPYSMTTSSHTSVFDTTITASNSRLVSAYYHTNRVHDFMKGYFPSFTGLDISLATNVDYSAADGPICNAFYSGTNNGSINFAIASPGCHSFAYAGDVVYHEYGHAINRKFYQSQGQSRMTNGALNEGSADVWAFSITDDPVIGKGTRSNGNVIRRYDQAPKVYPHDIVGETHNDGEIIAGAWWDLRQHLGSLDTMTQIFTKTYFDIPDGANGTEGEVYHEVLISALLNDDNDNNFSNGTPHFTEIVTAFAKHGIYLLYDAELSHTEIANQSANNTISINTAINVSEPAFLQDIKVFFKERYATQWDSLTMTDMGGFNYTAILPAFPEGSIIDYYFAAYDVLSLANTYGPKNFSPLLIGSDNNIPYQIGVGLTTKFSEDFENALTGWQIGLSTDDASAGKWIHASPTGSFLGGEPVQPNADHTIGSASGKCLVTGNAPGTNSPIGQADVDDGVTTVISPVFDLTGFTDPVIEYYRWYVNDAGSNPNNDYWEVNIKPVASSTFFQQVEYTSSSDYSWRRRIFKVHEYVVPAFADKVQLKFTASDFIDASAPNNGQSTVEAAVDDITIYDKADPLAVNNMQSIKTKIYPNPADEEIIIQLNEGIEGTMSIHDLNGRLLQTLPVNKTKTTYTLPTQSLPNGTYILMIHSGKVIKTKKINVLH